MSPTDEQVEADIVKRLRTAAVESCDGCCYGETMLLAAAEIERLTAAVARPARVYDAALGTITAQDRENAGDLLVDAQEIVSPQDCILPDELVGVVAEWFRKVRYEAVTADRLARPAEGEDADKKAWELVRRVIPLGHVDSVYINAARIIKNALSTSRPAQAEDGWKPIETAPKDGTPIDVWVPSAEFANRWCDVSWAKSSHQCISQYCDSCPKDWNRFGWRDPLSDERLKPTHWMPRPEPPRDAEMNRIKQPEETSR